MRLVTTSIPVRQWLFLLVCGTLSCKVGVCLLSLRLRVPRRLEVYSVRIFLLSTTVHAETASPEMNSGIETLGTKLNVNCRIQGIAAANPAFDVTPHQYITAIITEKGIIKEPYGRGIKKIL